MDPTKVKNENIELDLEESYYNESFYKKHYQRRIEFEPITFILLIENQLPEDRQIYLHQLTFKDSTLDTDIEYLENHRFFDDIQILFYHFRTGFGDSHFYLKHRKKKTYQPQKILHRVAHLWGEEFTSQYETHFRFRTNKFGDVSRVIRFDSNPQKLKGKKAQNALLELPADCFVVDYHEDLVTQVVP